MNEVLWGTAIAPPERTLRRWATDLGDLVVTDQGDQIMFYQVPTKVTYPLVTDLGDYLVTDLGDRIVAVVGDAGPAYFKTAGVTSDGLEPFAFLFQTNPWQPTRQLWQQDAQGAQGGENLFYWAYLAVSWSMSGTLRVTPTVDGKGITATLADGTIVSTVRPTFTLDQQPGSLQRKSQIFPIPLAQTYSKNGSIFTRTALRGERLQILIESTSALGVGELMLDGVQIDYEPVRKASYAAVDSATS